MKFLYPELLFGWFALIIPVLIHLFNFRKFRKVYFTKVSYLENIQEQTASFQKLKNLLILTCRLLVIFFLVLAFAQPYFSSNNFKANADETLVSIYIDNSYSMNLQNDEGDLLHQAKNKAIEIAKAYPINTKFQLITNELNGTQQELLDKETFINLVPTVKSGGFSHDYQIILSKQLSALSESENVKKDIFVLSDFQKNLIKKPLNTKNNFSLYLIPLKAKITNNLSVDTAFFLNAVHKTNNEQKLIVKVRNYGNKAVNNVPVELLINNQPKGFLSLNIKANSSLSDTIVYTNLSKHWQRGILRIKDYPIAFDDTLRFSYEIKPKMDILSIFNTSPNKFVDAAYKSDDYFNLKWSTISAINLGTLSNYPFVICSNLLEFNLALAQQLKNYVEKGGVLTIFIPTNAQVETFRKSLQTLGIDYPIQLNSKFLSGGKLAIKHPFFKGVFDRIPVNIDLPNASKSWVFTNSKNISKQQLIISQDQSNWLTYYPKGKGGIYLCALPLEPETSNLTQHSLFVPLMFQMALNATRPSKIYETVGVASEINIPNLHPVKEQLLTLKNKSNSFVAEPINTNNGFSVNFSEQIKFADFYTLSENDKFISTVAFNYNRKESELKFYSKKELKGLFKNQQVSIFKPNLAALGAKLKVIGLDRTLWKVCLILAFLFLLSETLLIRFYKPKN